MDGSLNQRVVEVTDADLPLYCPTPGDSLWNGHPRVYLPVAEQGEVRCPYCGTLYKLQGDGRPRHKH